MRARGGVRPVMGASELTIRRADPEKDRDAIRAVLEANLTPAAAAGRHEWLYLQNPEGSALVWLAEDENGQPVGTSAAHRRAFRVGGERTVVLGLSDFAVDKDHRSLGPALKLLRATLQPIKDGELLFSYDLPSAAMAAIYRRMKGIDLGPIARFAMPLAAAPIIKRRVGEGVAGKILGGMGDFALKTRHQLRRLPRGIKVSILEGKFGPQFDTFDERIGAGAPVAAIRSSRYLNWRYSYQPRTVVQARRDGMVEGFLVYRMLEPGLASITELCAADEPIAGALLTGAIPAARGEGAVVLSAQALLKSSGSKLLTELGFVKREEGPGPILVLSKEADAGLLSNPANWLLLEGDGDV